MTTRRTFLTTSAALGATAILPRPGSAQESDNTFPTDEGEIVVHPVAHASFVLEVPRRVIYVDPVGDPALYEEFPDPDIILITHEHGDHYSPETLRAIGVGKTQMVANKSVYDMLPSDLQMMAQSVVNGDTVDVSGLMVEAVPAYNITEGRLDYHPQGRDNGYVFEIGGRRIYVAGDTEATPEMRDLEEIYLAFVPMNLPFTMDAQQAAEGVADFQPAFVYPYHYRGRDGGTQDPVDFANALGTTEADTAVRLADWYPNEDI